MNLLAAHRPSMKKRPATVNISFQSPIGVETACSVLANLFYMQLVMTSFQRHLG